MGYFLTLDLTSRKILGEKSPSRILAHEDCSYPAHVPTRQLAPRPPAITPNPSEVSTTALIPHARFPYR